MLEWANLLDVKEKVFLHHFICLILRDFCLARPHCTCDLSRSGPDKESSL